MTPVLFAVGGDSLAGGIGDGIRMFLVLCGTFAAGVVLAVLLPVVLYFAGAAPATRLRAGFGALWCGCALAAGLFVWLFVPTSWDECTVATVGTSGAGAVVCAVCLWALVRCVLPVR